MSKHNASEKYEAVSGRKKRRSKSGRDQGGEFKKQVSQTVLKRASETPAFVLADGRYEARKV
jgi:hypothetical protein